MRKLVDVTNTDPASGNYPKGRMRDKETGILGTILGEPFLGDLIQFFQKIVGRSEIAENDSPDNEANTYQLVQAAELVIGNAFVGKIKGSDGSIYASKGPFPLTFTRTGTGIYEINELAFGLINVYAIQITPIKVFTLNSIIANIQVTPGLKTQIVLEDNDGGAEDHDFYITLTKLL